MNVVILSPHATRDALALRETRGARLIGWAGSAAEILVPLPNRWFIAADRALRGSFPGRIVLRLLGVDGSTQFARRLRRSRIAVEALSGAEVVVAAEDDAVLAAWFAGRGRGHRPRVVFGLAAGRAILTESGGTP